MKKNDINRKTKSRCLGEIQKQTIYNYQDK